MNLERRGERLPLVLSATSPGGEARLGERPQGQGDDREQVC